MKAPLMEGPPNEEGCHHKTSRSGPGATRAGIPKGKVKSPRGNGEDLVRYGSHCSSQIAPEPPLIVLLDLP